MIKPKNNYRGPQVNLDTIRDKFTKGEIKLFKHYISKKLIFGIVGIILMYVGVAGSVSSASKWWVGKGDAPQHIDYVWRIYNGSIPKTSDGITYPQFKKLLKPDQISRQAAAANPPLFYALHAPLIGPLLNKAQWVKAIAVGRMVNIIVGVGCIFALSWAGWLLGGQRKELFALSAPAIGVMTYRFTSLNIDFALDAQLTLISTLCFINMYKILKNGYKKSYLVTLSILLTLGMLTKVSFIVFMLVLPVCIFGRYYITTTKKDSKFKLIILTVFIELFVVAGAGWFYYFWNYRDGGNLFINTPLNYVSSRPVRGFKLLIFGSSLWDLLYAKYTKLPTISIFISSFAMAGYLVRGITRRSLFKNKAKASMYLIMLLVFIGTFGIQAKFSVSTGAINFRYMLPAILPISMFLSYGMLAFSKARGLLVAAAAFFMGISSLTYVVSPKGLKNSFMGITTYMHEVLKANLANDIPFYLPVLLMLSFFLGSVLLTTALWMISVKDLAKENLASNEK
jgi:4-amino-4-deoxy-L-arabinose transferase-like glycosyltransferase